MRAAALLLLMCLVATASRGDVKFTRLGEDQFVVHHRKRTLLGAEAKAVKTTYEECASVCVAAGYSHMEIKEQNVGERHHGGVWGGGRGASADIRIKLYLDPEATLIDEKDLVECKPLSDPEKVEVATKKLARGN